MMGLTLVRVDCPHVEEEALEVWVSPELLPDELSLPIVKCEDGDLACSDTVADQVVDKANKHVRLFLVAAGKVLISRFGPEVGKEERLQMSQSSRHRVKIPILAYTYIDAAHTRYRRSRQDRGMVC